jgi:DNA-binding response OmpR family regulator
MKPAFLDKAVILLIAPERSTTYRLDQILGGAGYDCLACRNEGDAQRAALERRADLLICDTHLAEEDGRQVCRRLKRHAQFADAGVIFLSASQAADVVCRSFGPQSAYFLRKPVDAELLLELVDRALWMPHSARQRVTV